MLKVSKRKVKNESLEDLENAVIRVKRLTNVVYIKLVKEDRRNYYFYTETL